MSELFMRLSILILVGIATSLLVWLGRHFVERQRQQALVAVPFNVIPGPGDGDTGMPAPAADLSPIRILAFSSADCSQCHQLQTPALRRVLQARGESVTVVDVDAVAEHELVQTYRVLTVPSTVVLDATGNARAINYGFANTQRLLEQIDAVMAKG